MTIICLPFKALNPSVLVCVIRSFFHHQLICQLVIITFSLSLSLSVFPFPVFFLLSSLDSRSHRCRRYIQTVVPFFLVLIRLLSTLSFDCVCVCVWWRCWTVLLFQFPIVCVLSPSDQIAVAACCRRSSLFQLVQFNSFCCSTRMASYCRCFNSWAIF